MESTSEATTWKKKEKLTYEHKQNRIIKKC
jgi:hypothetical protein